MVYPASPSAFWSVLCITIGNLLRGILFIFRNKFLPYSCILSKIEVIFKCLLQSLCLFYDLSKFLPLFFLVYFISIAVILLASLALMVQFSPPYNRAGRSSALHKHILVFFKFFFGIDILCVIHVVFTYLLNSQQMHNCFTNYRTRNLHKTYVKCLIVNCITNSCISNTCVTLQGIDYKFPEDDTIVSKHEGVEIICEIIVHLLVLVQNNKRCTVQVLK